MADDEDSSAQPLERVPSGVPGLDVILQGGLFLGGIYLVFAPPGSGKTILGTQISFGHVAAGGRAVFVTLLTESHSRLIAQLRTLEFFDSSVVGARLSFVTGYQALQQGKLGGLLDLLRKIVRDEKATLLVLDGVVTAGDAAASEREAKEFIHALQVFVELVGCTTLLLAGASAVGDQYALRTMVDGLIELRAERVGMDVARTIEVTKFRGGATILGRHLFRIDDGGITIHPRIESLVGRGVDRPDPTLRPPAAFGIAGLDAMLDGGLRAGSSTRLLGMPGSGRTLLGLNLLAAGANVGERGLYFGFFETGAELRRKAEATGIDLAGHLKAGRIELVSQSPRGQIADALAERLLASVRERGIRRLVIDGLAGFNDSLVYPERTTRFFGALCNELRSLGVVTVVADETTDSGGQANELTPLFDNILVLQHLPSGTDLERRLSVSKMREGAGELSTRAFSIDKHGFVVDVAATKAKTRRKPRRARR